MNPDVQKFTWKRLRPRPIFVRLGFFLISERIYHSVEQADILPGFRTDHSIHTLYLNFTNHTRGKGYWKLNTSLLEDPVGVEQLGRVIDIELAQEYSTVGMKWELTKLAIRAIV